jgi:small nuclear ribonucleoprotein G
MNIVLDEATEINGDGERDIGMIVIRGNSITVMETIDRVSDI